MFIIIIIDIIIITTYYHMLISIVIIIKPFLPKIDSYVGQLSIYSRKSVLINLILGVPVTKFTGIEVYLNKQGLTS